MVFSSIFQQLSKQLSASNYSKSVTSNYPQKSCKVASFESTDFYMTKQILLPISCQEKLKKEEERRELSFWANIPFTGP